MLAALIIDKAVTRGKRDEKMQQVIDKVDELEQRFDAAVEGFNKHCSNPDIHINQILLKLFDERFDTIRLAQQRHTTDIQRIEVMLQQKM